MKNNEQVKARNIFRKRLARDNFFGFKLTVLILIFVYVFGIFGAVIGNFISFEHLFIADRYLDQFVTAARTPSLVHFFLLITSLALIQFVTGISVAFLSFLAMTKKRIIFISPFLVSLLGGVFTNYLSKLSFHRGRPLNAIYFESSFSFPSGHATLAVVLYGFIIYYFWKKTSSRSAKNFLLAFGIVLILAIGFSRIYLGVHYLSDVLGGYLLGIIWLCSGIGLAEWRLEKRAVKLFVN